MKYSVVRESLGDTQALRNFSWLLLPVLAILLLYWQTAISVGVLWADSTGHTYGHGWLIATVCLWLLFQAGKQTFNLAVTPSILGVACLSILSAAWLLASQMSIQTVQQLLLPLLVLAAQWAFFGFATVRLCIVAIGYIYFALPIWDPLTVVFQWGTVFVERGLLRVVGIPAYFEGATVHLPSGVFAIEGACSGLHFVIVGLALAVLYGYLYRIKNFFGLVVLALATTVLANWIRVFAIIVAGHLTDMQHYLVRVEHIRFGWVVFAVMISLFFYVASKMTERPASFAGVRSETGAVSKERRRVVLVCALLGLIGAPAWSTAIANRVGPAVASPTRMPLADWVEVATSVSNWQPVFIGSDAQLQVTWRKNGREVELFQAVFANQRHGKKLAGYGNTAIGAWSGGIANNGEITQSLGNPRFFESELTDRQDRHVLIWQGYYVGDKWFVKPLHAQIWYGWKSLFVSDVSGVVALRANCDADCDAARASLVQVASLLSGKDNKQK